MTEEHKEDITTSPEVKADDIIIEHDGQEGQKDPAVVRKPKDDPLEDMRRKMEETEQRVAEERERRVAAERERDAAKTQAETTRTTLAKGEAEKIAAQEAAITSRLDAAKADVENAERALEEAIDTGRPAKEQIALQKKLAESVYKMKGAEAAKNHFDNWKEQQKNKPAPKVEQVNDGLTEKSRQWINSHPKYNTDKHYRRAAVAAHEDAVEDGVEIDSDEYFRRINEAVAQFDKNDGSVATVQTRKSSPTSVAAPVTQDSAMAGAGGSAAAHEKRTGQKRFKLDENMRRMAIQTYGKDSRFKLSDEEAYKKYAAKQLEIQQRRANGERV